jgi:hypothetical protein
MLGAPFDHVPKEGIGEIGLPVWASDQQCISRWRMSWSGRLSALLFGKVWLGVNIGKHTQPPVYLQASHPYVQRLMKRTPPLSPRRI